MAETPKITYVRGRGLAEVSRLIFAAKDIEIDLTNSGTYNTARESFIPMELTIEPIIDLHYCRVQNSGNLEVLLSRASAKAAFMSLQRAKINEEYITSKAEFEKLRTTGKLMFMQLPLVEIDGLCLIESQAQEHYLGQKYNMIGSNDKEMGNVYMLYTGARSFQLLCQPTWIIFQPEDKWDDCRKEAIKKARERYLPPFEKVLTENGTGFLVGSSVTIADCALFNILSYIDEGADYGNLLDEFPRCKSFVTTFSALPGIKKYLNSPRRFPPPDTEYAAEALAILF